MLELYQYEGCPECGRVREKLSELLLDFVARQVPRDVARRTRLQVATGQSEVPALVDPEERMIITEADDIIAYLEETYGEPDTAP
ncbi:MAG TPA: glutathione S-transferase N-terminal domain-containing protein [Candidatus Polarisedimenticolia bacterium]|nr:glutathione S-transferase N-terminal domain-containing protein [Candidatus Polarisedimenticolia bacterium]